MLGSAQHLRQQQQATGGGGGAGKQAGRLTGTLPVGAAPLASMSMSPFWTCSSRTTHQPRERSPGSKLLTPAVHAAAHCSTLNRQRRQPLRRPAAHAATQHTHLSVVATKKGEWGVELVHEGEEEDGISHC